MIRLVSWLQVSKINVCYWKEKVPGTYGLKQRFPCFVLTEGRDFKEHIYGLPSNEYPGLMKVREEERNPSNVLQMLAFLFSSNHDRKKRQISK